MNFVGIVLGRSLGFILAYIFLELWKCFLSSLNPKHAESLPMTSYPKAFPRPKTNSIYQNAVIIVLPIVSILFFMNLGIGFITKSAPQLNLFSFGFPLTILGTFFALYFSVDALQYVFNGLIDEAIGYVKSILNGGGSDG